MAGGKSTTSKTNISAQKQTHRQSKINPKFLTKWCCQFGCLKCPNHETFFQQCFQLQQRVLRNVSAIAVKCSRNMTEFPLLPPTPTTTMTPSWIIDSWKTLEFAMFCQTQPGLVTLQSCCVAQMPSGAAICVVPKTLMFLAKTDKTFLLKQRCKLFIILHAARSDIVFGQHTCLHVKADKCLTADNVNS